MKYCLSLLMASSLLWQAAAWGDEWVDYATAVTVTAGYLCSGELYGDSTGTDIKCDMGNPFVDSDGNVGIGTASPGNSLTVVGDLNATTLNATQLCDEHGAHCTDLSGGLSGVSSLASLTEIADVSASAPNDGDTLVWNSGTQKWESGSSDGGTPSGAVMAFNLASCPSGWSEYTPARGRFIRGIDSTGTNDPDGMRTLESIQEDAFQGHHHLHRYSTAYTGYGKGGSGWKSNIAASYSNGTTSQAYVTSPFTDGTNGAPRTSNETRPKNVALLFCEKD